MKIFLIILGVLVILFIAFTAVFPYILFHFLFARPSRSTKIPKYYVDTPHYKVSRAGMALLKTLPAEDAFVTSRDGLKLHAYLFKTENTPNPKKFVLGIHGYKSYSRPEFAPYAEFYRSLGFTLLLPDDRAHAPSEGKYIGFGVLDRLDCVDWAKYLVNSYGKDIEIYLHGVSMGGSTVIAASGENDLPVQVRGVIADCAFSSAGEIVEYHLKETAHLPVSYFKRRLEKLCQKEAGFNFSEYTPLKQIKNAKIPFLFVHGSKDTMVPPFMVHELYEACPTEKQLLFVENAGHGESIAFAPDEYHNKIKELFQIK